MPLKINFLAAICFVALSGNAVAASVADLERQVRAAEQARIAMQQRLEDMDRELNVANGRLEEANNAIRELQKNQQDLYRQIDSLKNLQNSGKPAPAAVKTSSHSGASSGANASASGGDREAYQKAVNLIMLDKNYAQAVKAFKDFISKYPDSTYLGNAYFWQGEANMKQGKNDEARQSFMVVIKDRDSNKRSESLYKLGLISVSQKNNDLAKKFFALVIQDYPGTTTAKLAQNELSKISN
ncbi:MAG: tol-pal system protein YbgF [Succinivibrionaceae bacterium]|nr:tol-pal system protein YbgF [Succinivibrionaceae bacterium]